MAEVVTFVDYRPPARYDLLPWTQARIEEASTETGTYTALETKTLSPVDSDPSSPAARSFTTELGTALGYWYRIVFLDATGDTSQPTTPVQNEPGSSTVSTSYVPLSELQRVLQKPAPTAAEQTAMQRVLDEAALKIDLYLGYTASSPAPASALQTLAEVNLGMGQELWSMEGRVAGIIPVGPDSVPVIAAHNIWNRWRLRLVPLKMNGWGLA